MRSIAARRRPLSTTSLAAAALGLAFALWSPAAAQAAAPVCQENQSYTVPNTSSLALPVGGGCSDADGDSMSGFPLSFPTHGTLASDGAGGAVYTPTAGYVGPDSFTYRVTANNEQSNTATVSITVTGNAGPRPPQCFDSGYLLVFEDRPAKFTPQCFDPDTNLDDLVPGIVAEPQHGDLTPAGISYTYTPDPGYIGPDAFSFKVSDGTFDSATINVNVQVNDFPEGNLPPTCPESHAFVETGSSVVLKANCVDPDNDPLSYGLAQPSVAHGTLSELAPNSVRYTPAAGYTGSDRLGYSADDPYHDPVTFAADITVLPVGALCCETAPEATPEEPYAASVASPVDGPIYIDSRATTSSDPDGYSFLDQEFDITAPDAIDPDQPLEFVFKLDREALDAANLGDAGDVVVYRNREIVDNACPPVGARTDPGWWPCIADRANPGGDAWITVLTMSASVWNFAAADISDADGDGVADEEDNCVNAANPDQLDADADGAGAACDTQEVPSSKDDCKRDGWRAFNGTYAFRNQGDCVSFVATGGKNRPGG